MPKPIRKEIENGGIIGNVRIRVDGLYEIRYRRNGYNISVTAKELNNAKEKFIKALAGIKQKKAKIEKGINFSEFATKWLTESKKPTVKENTFYNINSIFNKYINPTFKKYKVNEITAMTIQPLFNRIEEQGKGKTAEEVKKLLKQIFEAAIAERLIPFSPMQSVIILPHEYNTGVALTYQEEADFLKAIENSPYKYAYIILLYTGIRRCELSSFRMDDIFCYVITGKRRKGLPEKERKIPITPMFKVYLNEITSNVIKEITLIASDALSKNFKDVEKKHHLHELRHTFISRCREKEVPREIVALWVGHTPNNVTEKSYTHYSDEFMLNESSKVNYLLPQSTTPIKK